MIFIIVTLLTVGSAFASTNDDSNLHVNASHHQDNSYSNALIDNGYHRFYWGERGGIFSYNWKTYRTPKGSVIIYIHYKTVNNTWYGRYSIVKFLNYHLKIVNTSPELMVYTGHLSKTTHTRTSLSPLRFYWSKVRGQIKADGYYN